MDISGVCCNTAGQRISWLNVTSMTDNIVYMKQSFCVGNYEVMVRLTTLHVSTTTSAVVT